MSMKLDFQDEGTLDLTLNGMRAPHPVDVWVFFNALRGTILTDIATVEEQDEALTRRNKLFEFMNLPFKDLSHTGAVMLCDRLAKMMNAVKKNADRENSDSNSPDSPASTESTASPPTSTP